MGGQACILYGAAEFSRDTDLAVLARLGRHARLADALAAEERRERGADARHWAPLKSEIEVLRLERVRRARTR